MIYTFGNCILDTQLYTVQRAGQSLRLRPKVFQVLRYLLEHRDRVISRQELCEHIWPNQFISDATLGSTLRAVRQALGGHRAHATDDSDGARPRLSFCRDSGGGPSPRAGRVRRYGGDSTWRGVPTGRRCGCLQLEAWTESASWSACCVGPWRQPHPGVHRPRPALQALASVTQEVVAQYGGTLLPVADETLLAVFGLPVAHEDHAQRAVLAALRLQQALGARGPVRLGVHTGTVAIGSLAEGGMLATAVVGEPLTQAVALQAHAAPGTILCSATTARLVRGLVRLAVVAGLPSPGTVYQVRGLRPVRVSGGQGHTRPVSPFVGRACELATLHALLAQAEAGQGQVVGIVGEAGLGKSRLMTEFRRSLRGRRLTYLAGHCLAYRQTTPYGPVLALLRQACGLRAADQPATIARKVCQRLAAEDWHQQTRRRMCCPCWGRRWPRTC